MSTQINPKTAKYTQELKKVKDPVIVYNSESKEVPDRVKGLKKHGMSRTRFYRVWAGARSRGMQKGHNWLCYRHVTFQNEWHDFRVFKDDMYESYNIAVAIYGEDNTQLDRIDRNKGYCKENTRWVCAQENLRNRYSTLYVGDETLIDVCLSKGLHYGTVFSRLKNGWSIERALSTIPLERYRRNTSKNKTV